MSNFQLWRYWLLAVSVFIAVFGIIMASFSNTIVFAFFNAQINPVFWGSNPVPVPAQLFQAWVYGAWGATVMGWGVTMFFIAYYPFNKRERWAWNAVFVSLIMWYTLDTGISWAYGVFINVLLNTMILVLVLIPLVFTFPKP